MTPKSKWSADLLSNPELWSELIRRLSGADPDYDDEIIRSFCGCFKIPAGRVLTKIRAHGFSVPRTLN
jgi:hypothetical protein